jgi:hypothetical protein
LATTFTSATNGTTITCLDTTGFVVNQTIQFKSPDGVTTVGNILVDGTVYFVSNIINGTDFEVSLTRGGSAASFTIGSGGTLPTYVGGQQAVRVETDTAHNLSTNDVVRIDGVSGSTQLNNKQFYVHVISSTEVDLYEYFAEFPSLDYNPINGATNYPVTEVSNYISGGYVWVNDTFILFDALATDVVAISGTNYIEVNDSTLLVDNTPVYFMEDGIPVGTETSITGVFAGERYYLKSINYGTNTFSISETYNGPSINLTLATGLSIKVKQWLQTDVDRLYVTVNGLRVPSSSLRVNPGNQISILTPITTGDEVILTAMIPTATPNENVYLQMVNTEGEGTVYRANSSTRTWLTQDLFELQDDVFVADASRLTNTIILTELAPASVLGFREIGLAVNKNDLLDVTVYNNNTSEFIDPNYFEIVLENLSPILRIKNGSWIATNDELTITCVEGKYIMINGEIMHIHGIDFNNNQLIVHRGAEGTGVSAFLPKYSEVYGLLLQNQMTDINYNETWNKIPGIYNPVEGDPLQIAESQAANFLKSDIT